jgi:tRNA-specific 2-thiouridylase
MKNNQKSVLIGLSGGVDSSVAAILLKKQGYKVIGCFLKCFSDTKDPITGECNWIKEKQMAQKIASILEIPLITLDLEKEYKKQVIIPMIREYKHNLTPNPDISCNTIIKFPWLIKEANKRKIDYVATGHYAKTKKTKNGYELHYPKDKMKDQTYFLYELNQQILSRTLFPIGNLTKSEVREIAKKHNLPNWNKSGTRGICFVGKVNMKSFLERNIKNNSGKILDPEGEIIGTHPGASYFTIGQRIGPHLGMEIHKPRSLTSKKWYVASKTGNTIIAAPEGHKLLKKSIIKIKNLHLINPKEKIPTKLKARIRHLGQLYPGRLSNNTFKLKKPIEAIAPGQHLVIYNKSKVIGGGEIA